MKIMTIFGKVPEIIRLSLILKVLDQHCEHVTVLAARKSDRDISDALIRSLDIRTPDINLGIDSQESGDFSSQIISKAFDLLDQHKPDRILVIGGSTSALVSLAAAHRRIPVFHMGAGDRCFDAAAPDEVTRKTVDNASSVLLPYTNRSKDNLLSEGVDRSRIFVTGNPINEALDNYSGLIDSSAIMEPLSIRPFEYFLMNLESVENSEDLERIKNIFQGLAIVAAKFKKKVLVSVDRETTEKLSRHRIAASSPDIEILGAIDYFDFVKLQKNSLAVLTDSGTVQEECCIFGVPNVTLGRVTDRPETVDCGSNILSGCEPDDIVRCVELALAQPAAWTPPAEYLVSNVSQTVCRIILGHIRP